MEELQGLEVLEVLEEQPLAEELVVQQVELGCKWCTSKSPCSQPGVDKVVELAASLGKASAAQCMDR